MWRNLARTGDFFLNRFWISAVTHATCSGDRRLERIRGRDICTSRAGDGDLDVFGLEGLRIESASASQTRNKSIGEAGEADPGGAAGVKGKAIAAN